MFEKRDDDFFEAYRFILPGYNARPLELSGAVGIEQLKKLDRMVEIRRRNAASLSIAVCGRRAVHHPAGASRRAQFLVLIHGDPQPEARHRSTRGDGAR